MLLIATPTACLLPCGEDSKQLGTLELLDGERRKALKFQNVSVIYKTAKDQIHHTRNQVNQLYSHHYFQKL